MSLCEVSCLLLQNFSGYMMGGGGGDVLGYGMNETIQCCVNGVHVVHKQQHKKENAAWPFSLWVMKYLQ